MASKRNGTLYIGVTNDIVRRVYEHKTKITKGFTEKYNVNQLVWFESTESIESAITKEKQRHIAPNRCYSSFSLSVTDEFKSIAVISFCFL